jgi:hypothetical protein
VAHIGKKLAFGYVRRFCLPCKLVGARRRIFQRNVRLSQVRKCILQSQVCGLALRIDLPLHGDITGESDRMPPVVQMYGGE